MFTRAFATSISVSDKQQKNLGESNHPIGRTILMQMMTSLSSGAYGITYAKAPTWNSQRVPRWYASETSNFETRAGPSAGYASQIDWRMRGEIAQTVSTLGQPHCQ